MNSNPTNLRALVFCGDRWHPAETIRRGLAALGNIGFQFEFVEDAGWPANRLSDFQAVVLARANLVSTTGEGDWLTTEAASLLQGFVQQGGGLLAVHAGISRYDKLPLRAALGGAFKSHPPECDVVLEPHPTHELTRGLKPFTVFDEHYFVTCEAAPEDVFLQSHSEHGVQPAGWTRREGRGRVCVLTAGHGPEVWLHPQFQKLLAGSLRWAATLNSDDVVQGFPYSENHRI